MINAFKKILTQCCVIFSVLILIVAMGVSFVGAPNGFGINHVIILALFILSFVIACSNVIFSLPKLAPALKYIFHLAAVLASSAVFMKIVNNLPGKTILIAVIIIAIVHAAIFIIISAVKKSKAKSEDYENVYKKEK